MKKISFPVFFLLLFSLSASVAIPGEWNVEQNGKQLSAKTLSENLRKTNVVFPGGVLVFKEQMRYQAHPMKEMFDASELVFQVKASGISVPLKAWIFVKDKDGAWFQTDQEFSLKPDQWTRLSVRLDIPGKNLLPIGHRAAWSGFYASKMFTVGLSIYSDDMQQAELEWKEPQLEGKRRNELPSIVSWNLPALTDVGQMTPSRFDLDKEYFNPFDPDAVAVDFEVLSPDQPDQIKTYPAFYSQDCLRKIHFTKETVSPLGLPHWEFRFIPKISGIHKIRLKITDFTVAPPIVHTIYSEWKEIFAAPSNAKGFIRVSKKNPRYFEYENGDFFYPVGINIHSNTDQRSENSFGFGHLPDRGNVDYEEYIRRCSESGINLMEVWMAAWTYAIEWSSFRSGYYGLGVYNMVNAWKLDALLEYAQKYGMNISLVLDNHGKLADTSDPEWHDSPFNDTTTFAKANSAFLSTPYEFWKNERAVSYTLKRNRYIAARWGAYPNIFAMQLWSEVDLVGNSGRAKEDKSIIVWHQTIANDIKKHTQGHYLTATHVCGDIGNTMNWKILTIDPKEMDHVCGDAYRDKRITIVNQMQKHQDQIMNIMKPVLITEYGGTAGASETSYIIGDIHGGIWAALFTRHAGTPWLWWHDFIHIRDQYIHFSGFSKFLKGLDLRPGNISFGQIKVNAAAVAVPPQPTVKRVKKLFHSAKETANIPEIGLSGLYYNQNNAFLCGWIYNVDALHNYRLNLSEIPTSRGVKAEIKTVLNPGDYLVQFFDTFSNDLVSSYLISQKQTNSLQLSIPDIQLDIALKITGIGGKIR